MIAIIDYGAGNRRSVTNAVLSLGYQPVVTNLPDVLLKAGGVILPGVGAARDTMDNLRRLGLLDPIRHYIGEDRPFLGICVGMQILFNYTEEGDCECLGIIPGRVRRFSPGPKIPHMGWNQVKEVIPHPVFREIPDGTDFYFVHSYYCVPDDNSLIIGETDYNITFCSAVARGKLVATQFHPEKSGRVGLQFYRNFIEMSDENTGG